MVADLRAAAAQPDYPPVLLFVMGSVSEAEGFFRKLWPEARVVSDQARFFYDAFDVRHAGPTQMMHPELAVCMVRAMGKGHTGGPVIGDPLVRPGLFLVQGDAVLWGHPFRHIADHPDFNRLPQLLPR